MSEGGENDPFAKPLYGLTPVPRVRIPPSPPFIKFPCEAMTFSRLFEQTQIERDKTAAPTPQSALTRTPADYKLAGVLICQPRARHHTNVRLRSFWQGVHVVIAALCEAGRCAAALGIASEAVCSALFSIRRCPLEDGVTSGTCQDIHTGLSGVARSHATLAKFCAFDAPIRSACAWCPPI